MKRLISLAILALAVLPGAAQAATTILTRTFLVDTTLGNVATTALIPGFDTPGQVLDSVEVSLFTRWTGLFDVTNTNTDLVGVGDTGQRAIGSVTSATAAVISDSGLRVDTLGSQLNVRSLPRGATTTVFFAFDNLAKTTLTSDFSDFYDFVGSDDLTFTFFPATPTLSEIQGQPALFLLKSWQALSTLTVTYRSSAAAVTPPTAVPEPATWAMLIAGFGFVGASLRARRKQGSIAV